MFLPSFSFRSAYGLTAMAFDLDQRTLWAARRLRNRAARGHSPLKYFGVDFVDNGKLTDVDHKDSRL